MLLTLSRSTYAAVTIQSFRNGLITKAQCCAASSPTLIYDSSYARSAYATSYNSRRKPAQSRKPNDPRVNPNSLRATLEAHRAARVAVPIRKALSTGKRPRGSKRPDIEYVQAKVPPVRPPPDVIFPSVRRPLDLVRPRHRQIQLEDTVPYDISEAGYEGKPLDLGKPWSRPTGSGSPPCDEPWMEYLSTRNLEVDNALERLDAEVKAFEEYVSLSEPETKAIASVFDDIVEGLGIARKHCAWIGSHQSGLAEIMSDIDINIGSASGIKPRILGERGPSPGRPKARQNATILLNQSAFRLQDKSEIGEVGYVPARVPIVHGKHNPTGVHFDIQATPVLNTSEHVKNYVNEYPSLRPLHFLLKYILRIRGANLGKAQGLNSYVSFMMLVAIFKLDGGRYARQDTAQPLLDFLLFYSQIDFWFDGVSVDPFEVFPRRRATPSKSTSRSRDPYILGRRIIEVRNPDMPWLMCLQDPADPSHDLGVGAHLIKHIQASFGALLTGLKGRIEEWDKLTASQKRQTSLLGSLVAANYGRVEEQRALLNLHWENRVKARTEKPA